MFINNGEAAKKKNGGKNERIVSGADPGFVGGGGVHHNFDLAKKLTSQLNELKTASKINKRTKQETQTHKKPLIFKDYNNFAIKASGRRF